MTNWSEFKNNIEEKAKTLPVAWPQTIGYHAFDKTPCQKPKPLIANLLDCGSRILFGGGSKTYKTWLQCDLAICLACGAPWLGFETVPTRVLYVNFELKDYYMQYRLRKIREAKEIDASLDNLTIWNLRGFDFDRPNFIDQLLALCQEHGFQMVFIDPFYKLLRQNEDENKQTDMNAVLSSFNPVNKAEVTTAFGIHFSKGNQSAKEPSDRISGAGTLIRDPDDIVTLTRHEEDGAFTLDFLIRDHPPVNPFVIQWQAPIMVRTNLDPAKIKKPKTPPQKPKAERIHDLPKAELLLLLIPDQGEFQSVVVAKAQRLYHKRTEVILDLITELESARKILRIDVPNPNSKGGRPVKRILHFKIAYGDYSGKQTNLDA